ncbi:sugar ABC transporter permease [Lachnospiraceae bacterium 48-42]
MNRTKKRGFFKYENVGILFVFPAFLYMIIFVGYPIVRNIVLSLQEVTVRTLTADSRPFVGLKNYIKIFQDPVFTKSMLNTLVFTVCCLAVQFLIGFMLALFFNQHFSVSKPVRGLLLIPWMVPITVTALMFKFIFGADVGILNYILKNIGIISQNIDWLTSPDTALFAIVCANVWIGIPFNMILISTGLTTIPKDLYESASIDGAGKLQMFFKITLPLLRSTIESVLILGFIYTFKVFDLVYVMTKGGPVNSTHMLSTYSYKLSFEMFKYSEGAAVANVLLVILLIVGVFYLRATKEDDE